MADAGVTWTAERIGLLRKLWSEGLSASQIAAELGGNLSFVSAAGGVLGAALFRVRGRDSRT